MKFSVNWLREFIDLPKTPEEIADLLTRAGVETKNIETRGAKIEKVLVSQITASSRHPNADRLTVCEVDDGSAAKRQIVCGATNYKVGDKIPLALPGAKLPNGTEIRKSKLRGVDSEGMLCSPIELGLGEDASGPLILSPGGKSWRADYRSFPKRYDSRRRDHSEPRRFAQSFWPRARNRRAHQQETEVDAPRSQNSRQKNRRDD